MIRPRAGDFCYTAREFDVMLEDVRAAREFGANGVVLGVLTAERKVDVKRTRELVAAAQPLHVTYHRAFDVSANLHLALEDVIASGADRILTSGGERLGLRGVSKVARLVHAAQGRITILGAGGIRLPNVREFVQATGVKEIHTSLRSPSVIRNGTKRAAAILSDQDSDLTYSAVRKADVLRLRKELDAIAAARQDESRTIAAS